MIDRLKYWMTSAIKRTIPELDQNYQFSFPENPLAYAPFAKASSLVSVTLASELQAGEVFVRVVCRQPPETISAELPVMLIAHPLAVVASKSLARGVRISRADVKLAPVPKSQWRKSYSSDLDRFVGKEVHGIVRDGEPIAEESVGPPILIHRGDFIELRIVGGGVVITTNAKAVGEGAEGEWVEVETIQPRKRVVATVASSSVAEIITRPPRVPE
jgi:flagella basal body P-ring formation protein FlgA